MDIILRVKGENMTKIVVVSLLFLVPLQAFDYVRAYREGGIEAIKAQVRKELVSEEYWNESLKNEDIRWGYYESVQYIFVANKKDSTLILYEKKGPVLEQRYSLDSLMGSKQGDKMVEGDLKTPIGAYDLTSRLTKLDQFYGPLAYVTSYPNIYDRVQGKTGSGIWIHGLPFNGDREINTRGCIAINNDRITEIDKMINHKKAVLITADGSLQEMSKAQAAILLSDLFEWRDAWEKNDLQTYLNFYDTADFRRFDKMDFRGFKTFKQRIFDKREVKTIDFSNINISPYPNEKGEALFRIAFYEKYSASGGHRFEGNKELYVRLRDGKMQIIAEK